MAMPVLRRGTAKLFVKNPVEGSNGRKTCAFRNLCHIQLRLPQKNNRPVQPQRIDIIWEADPQPFGEDMGHMALADMKGAAQVLGGDWLLIVLGAILQNAGHRVPKFNSLLKGHGIKQFS